jgi:hypothetical protein
MYGAGSALSAIYVTSGATVLLPAAGTSGLPPLGGQTFVVRYSTQPADSAAHINGNRFATGSRGGAGVTGARFEPAARGPLAFDPFQKRVRVEQSHEIIQHRREFDRLLDPSKWNTPHSSTYLPPAICRPVSVIGRELHSKFVWFLSSCVAVNSLRNASSGLAAWTAGAKVRKEEESECLHGRR